MKRYLITSALPYINGIKHLGNLIGSMLPADVYARYLRQQGAEVLFICGTDEHGTPAELAAEKAKSSVNDYCANMYKVQKDIYEGFSLSFDYFGRSSSPENSSITQEIFNKLDANGYIIEQEIEQFYSIEDKRFLPDRYVVGECPKCGYQHAKGDQCESCGILLDPTELKDPRSVISGSRELEIRKSKHLYLQLSKLQDKVSDWIDTRQAWSVLSAGISKKWLMEGLTDRCITRDLSWGIKVPKPGYDEKRFYVWFDAPMAYISISVEWAKSIGKPDEWKKWWVENSETHYVQFMAKDNVVFHSIFWPAMLMGSGENWKQVDNIKSFNWLNYENNKFSTSQGRGVFTDQALELFPADYWRYYLLAIAPESSDSNFTFSHFAEIINSDLANNLGNFVSRVVTLIQKNFDEGFELTEKMIESIGIENIAKIEAFINSINQSFEQLRFTQVISEIRAFWSFGNEYITSSQPWRVIKTDKEAASVVLGMSYLLIVMYAIVSAPIIPTISQSLFEILGIDGVPGEVSFDNVKSLLKKSHFIKLPNKQTLLIAKIQPEQVVELTNKFSGTGV